MVFPLCACGKQTKWHRGSNPADHWFRNTYRLGWVLLSTEYPHSSIPLQGHKPDGQACSLTWDSRGISERVLNGEVYRAQGLPVVNTWAVSGAVTSLQHKQGRQGAFPTQLTSPLFSTHQAYLTVLEQGLCLSFFNKILVKGWFCKLKMQH